MKKAVEWIEERDEFAILYDSDGDGICSCALMQSLLESMGKEVVKTAASPRPSFEKNPAINLLKRFDNIIVLDISMDEKNIEALKDKSVLNVDHHESGLSKSEGNVVVIKKVNPYTPTALLVYNLGKKMVKNFEENDWIAAVGVISDYGGPQHEDFVRKILPLLCLDSPCRQ